MSKFEFIFRWRGYNYVKVNLNEIFNLFNCFIVKDIKNARVD